MYLYKQIIYSPVNQHTGIYPDLIVLIYSMHHKVRSYSILQQAIAIFTAKLSKLLAEVILKSRMIYQSLLVLSALVISRTTANHAEGSPTISPVVIPPSTGGEGACPSNEVREAVKQNLTEEVRTLLREVVRHCWLLKQSQSAEKDNGYQWLL